MTKIPTTTNIQLRNLTGDDLPTFFQLQLDPDANYMADYTSQDPTDQLAFNARWSKILADRTITLKTILYDGQVAGSIMIHTWSGEPEVGIWLGRAFWGMGIAAQALSLFLDEQSTRPLYTRVDRDNLAYLHVLEKCGFTVSGENKWFSNARGREVDELVLVLK